MFHWGYCSLRAGVYTRGIGIRDRDGYEKVLGSHGVPGRNARGKNLLGVYNNTNSELKTPSLNTTSMSVHYQQRTKNAKHARYHSYVPITPQRIRNCKVTNDGVKSDHFAVQMKLALSTIKFKERKLNRGTVDWEKIVQD